MSRRVYKAFLAGLLLLFIASAGFMQRLLNRERGEMGITRREPLENAPPVLALTTQVLGGFRGLIANALWIRANTLQQEGKYFEMVQLADWITKLEPHFVQVWLVQAWNMAYNISVKCTDHADRWRWVQRGIELLRDQGIQYNPQETLLYRELAWFFQHKMGQNLDDAHYYYKAAWASEMMDLFGGERPDFERLIDPQTADEQQRARLLRERYKMDAAKMREIDERYGPLDWRLPEAHSMYWGMVALEKSRPEDLITVRRVIYQSMNQAFQHGRLVLSSNAPPRLFPNLDIIPKANRAFEEQIEQDVEKRDVIRKAHRNFLKDVPYQLFLNNRVREGEQWLRYLQEKYPEAVPANASLAEFSVDRATENATVQSQDKVRALIQGFVVQSYVAIIEDRPDDANAYILRAREIWNAYDRRTKSDPRLALATIPETQRLVLTNLLEVLTLEARARLMTALRLPAEAPRPNER